MIFGSKRNTLLASKHGCEMLCIIVWKVPPTHSTKKTEKLFSSYTTPFSLIPRPHQMMQWIETTAQSLSDDHTDIGDSLSSAEINKQAFHNFQSRISVSPNHCPPCLSRSFPFSIPSPRLLTWYSFSQTFLVLGSQLVSSSLLHTS